MDSETLNYRIFAVVLIGLPVALMLSPWAGSLWPGLLFLLPLLVVMWLISLLMRDAGIVDIFWGPGIAAMAWWYAYQAGFAQLGPKHILLLVLVTLWALRLGGYLAWRNLGKAEDYRYARMRSSAGRSWWWFSFFKVFGLQGLIIWTITALFWRILSADGALVWTDYLGLALWSIGFFFEAVGDWQLARFKADSTNQGKVLNTGLWCYTRHPNYFGDACVWWGYFCLVLSHPQAVWFLFCPVYMTFLLLKISGVAMLERDQSDKKPTKYQEYIKQTSVFLPWWPKSVA